MVLMCVGVIASVTACGSGSNADDNGAAQNGTNQNTDNNNDSNANNDTTNNGTTNNGNTNDATDGTDNRDGEGVLDEIGDDVKDGAEDIGDAVDGNGNDRNTEDNNR